MKTITGKNNKGKNENSYKLFIFNNLSRLEMTVLDKTDLKIKPLNLYYHFDQLDASISQKSLITQLNEFTNSPTEFERPIFFSVEKYLAKYEVDYPGEKFYNSQQITFSNIMRFSKFFYTYHVRNPNESERRKRCNMNYIFFLINLLLFVGMIVISAVVLELNGLLCFLMTFGSIIVADVIIFLIINCVNNRIKRIDCIYDSDFKKIFIGTTIMNEKCYKNTYEFALSEINKFYVKENNKKTFLSVSVLDNDIDICEIINKIDLNSFVSILNDNIKKKN